MDDLDKLIRALEKIVSGNATQHFIRQEIPKLKKTIISSVQTWYDSYSPHYYERTYNFMSVGFTSEIRGAGNSIFLNINSNSIDDYAYDTADYVFTGIADYGFHGSPQKAPASEPLVKLIEQKAHELLVKDYAAFILKFIDS